MSLTKATYSMVSGAPVNVLDYGADPTGTNDSYAAFVAAIAASSNCVIVPDGIYIVSEPVTISKLGVQLNGLAQSSNALPNYGAVIYPTNDFVGDATIIVDGSTRWTISNLTIEGRKADNINAISIVNGPLGTIQNCQIRTSDVGIKLINGNCQRWSNIIAEGCNIGFQVEPDVTDNTNGCVMSGLRATLSEQWGLYITKGAASTGHSSSYWDISAEGGYQGIGIVGGNYCHYEVYAENNSMDEFYFDPNAPHYYFVKNVDNQPSIISGLAVGWNGTGGNLYFDGGYSPDRVEIKDFTGSGGLSGIAIKTYQVTNSSAPPAQLNLTLGFLSYAPVGFRANIYKLDNTTGFIPVAPAGITLLGDTGLFGAYPTSVMKLEVVKISSTQAILVASGA